MSREARMATAIISSPFHEAHDDPEHVEQAARLSAINAAIDQSGLRPDLLELSPRGAVWLDEDTYLTAGSLDAARMAAGAAVEAVEAVVRGQAANAFALVR